MDKTNLLTAGIFVLTAVYFTPAFPYSQPYSGSQTMTSLNIAGQVGQEYDPLFFDVMVYIFGTMIFAIFLLSVIGYWIRRKGIGATNTEKWFAGLEKHYEREGIGLTPEESRK